MTPAILNIIGLCLDILGVVLLFIFGLPAEVNRSGAVGWQIGTTEEGPAKARFYDWMSRFALLALVVGFGFQIWANFLTL